MTVQSQLRVYNTLTRKQESFKPIREGRVNLFVCGPTVYDVSHIGHAKTYVAYDIVARYLRWKGFSVFFVMNITDIDDKIINRAHEGSENPLRLADRYARLFYKDMKDMRVDCINLYPKASDHIPEIIGQIEGLIEKGLAYRVDSGDVYFDVTKFPGYGKLSRQRIEDLVVHRVDPNPLKRNPADFVLWKSQKQGEIAWDSPWGKGRPGWHIEDTAMTVTYFGPTYDIHGGGTDLIFPHHEAEIAQAEGLTGKEPLAKYWLHTGLLNIRGQEMHKTLKNIVPIQEAISKVGVDALRVFYASTHYRSPVDYTEEALVQASSLARRFSRAYELLVLASARPPKIREDEEVLRKDLEDTRAEFFLAMNDDFNTPGALTAYIKIVGLAEKLGENPGKVGLEVRRSLEELGSILGVLQVDAASKENSLELVNLLLELRTELRLRGEYQLSDKIRDRLSSIGIVVEDSLPQKKSIGQHQVQRKKP
ncbi:cysteine--tRNA ligase [Candidatus Bathyarchaeota archaeon]|nr:MAG: cysteine--tRNA ligase [Candidatus Bathyarchaeota archaeon]